MKINYFGVGAGVSAVALCAAMLFTNPTDSGPLSILAVFLFLYVALICLVTIGVYFGSRLLQVVFSHTALRRRFPQLTVRKSYQFALVIALVPVMLLALQSVGTISLYEIVLVAVFLGVGIFYISRQS